MDDLAAKNTRINFIAACMMHVEGFYSVKSMAFRNRNPGNIEDANGHMRVYSSLEVGYHALVTDIAVNRGKTLGEFLKKYAPPSENNTSMYTQVVCTLTGIAATEVI